MDHHEQTEKKISLTGSVALGTGVMIGAGIFALIGQVAELAGGWVPWAFLAGAVVVGFSSYSYIRYSVANPSSGGIAMLLKASYGPGVIAGTFSLFMYVSMILAEALLGRTLGTYLQALRHAPRYGAGPRAAGPARAPVPVHHRRAGDPDGGPVRPLPDRFTRGHLYLCMDIAIHYGIVRHL